MKKVNFVLVVLCLSFIGSGQVLASSIARLGVNLNNNLTMTLVDGHTAKVDINSMDFYGAYEFLWRIPDLPLETGFGFELPRNIDDGQLVLNFMPFYGMINASFESEKVKPYFSGKLGYSFFNGPVNWILFSASNYTGGLFYSIGGGLFFNNGFRVEISYSAYNGQNTLTELQTGHYIPLRFSYTLSNIALSLGYFF